jgi:hypothetical protein
MALKSERFEMRLDEDILARVDRWRAMQDDVPSRAEGMRRLVELGLTRTTSDAVRLSDGEKLIVTMMSDIYKHLKLTKGDIDPDFLSEVTGGGHYWALKWRLVGLYHDHEDDPRDVSFVVNVLDMWDFMERAYAKLSKKDKDRVEKEAQPYGKYVTFTGFDGNNESALNNIARFLIEVMDRFPRFKGRELNSHMPTLATYTRMLGVFEPMRSTLVGADLNATKIIAILKAKMQSGHTQEPS